MKDIIIIGAGAIGAFLARNLSKYELNVLVIEKENDVGDATSMANSAIVHSGYDPVPGTNKARFNVEGNKLFPKICEELDVEFEQCGSLTVATEPKQLEMLKELARRGELNGVPTKLLTPEEVKALEPNITPEVQGALLCPTAGIVNPFTLVAHAFENALDNGVELALGTTVTAIRHENGHYQVQTDKGTFEAKVVINAAGVAADHIASLVEEIDWSIQPRKGEYYVLDHYAPGLVNHVLFPLPSEKGKGILVTMTTAGNYLVGPSSEFVDDKDDHSTDLPTLANVRAQATNMVPKIPFREQIRTFAGLRATPSTHDFIIGPSKSHEDFINVAGIESPGLVSSPAIGEYVVEHLVRPLLDLKPKKSYNPCVKKYVTLSRLSEEQKKEVIAKNPHYGEMICNCEKVSLGEIEDVLSRSLPTLTIKAIKKRTRAGFGKCQGGFCQPKVLFLLAKHLGVSPLEVLYDRSGSEILDKEAK
ncbi:MAG: NAD(P)/FAD-dependent oxidoreductase [Bacilli bacterium]|nr:NAD(P)/FAD-dependent oxidoreductase [Bacilli bacterium]